MHRREVVHLLACSVFSSILFRGARRETSEPKVERTFPEYDVLILGEIVGCGDVRKNGNLHLP
jgi:hypothetical protein